MEGCSSYIDQSNSIKAAVKLEAAVSQETVETGRTAETNGSRGQGKEMLLNKYVLKWLGAALIGLSGMTLRVIRENPKINDQGTASTLPTLPVVVENFMQSSCAVLDFAHRNQPPVELANPRRLSHHPDPIPKQSRRPTALQPSDFIHGPTSRQRSDAFLPTNLARRLALACGKSF